MLIWGHICSYLLLKKVPPLHEIQCRFAAFLCLNSASIKLQKCLVRELLPKMKKIRLRAISLQGAIEKCPILLFRILGAPILFSPPVCILLFRQGFLEPPFFWYKKMFLYKTYSNNICVIQKFSRINIFLTFSLQSLLRLFFKVLTI